MQDLNTEVALLKKEVSDVKVIFSRLDVAIEKIRKIATRMKLRYRKSPFG